jgi:CubicO group peptidase (beta-lactamase class C family)
MWRTARRTPIRMIGVIAATILVLTAVSACTIGPGPSVTAPAADEDLEAAIGEDVDIALETLDRWQRLRAVLVFHDGEPLFERYIASTPDDYWDVRSVAQSVTSTLVGIAIDEGLIRGVDATLGELLTRWSGVLTPETSAITLHSVLTHTADFAAENDPGEAKLRAAPDPVAAFLVDRAARGAGDGSFHYSDGGSHILAAILREASGTSVLEFARRHLFDPLGVVSEPALEVTPPPAGDQLDPALTAFDEADFAWLVDGGGVHAGGFGLKLRPADLARLGQLYLDRGEWEREPLVSEAWIAQATQPQVTTGADITGAYGYQWWTEPNDGYFCALGRGGTAIVVSPQRDVVVVVASEIHHAEAREYKTMTTASGLLLAELILNEFS